MDWIKLLCGLAIQVMSFKVSQVDCGARVGDYFSGEAGPYTSCWRGQVGIRVGIPRHPMRR